MRVVCDQKNVFPFDGEHVHFMQASDKSVTSSQFTPAEGGMSVKPKTDPKVEILIQSAETDVDAEEEGQVFEIEEIEESDAVESTDTVPAASAEGDNADSSPAEPMAEIDPNDFREKIKRRLQKALQNKKK